MLWTWIYVSQHLHQVHIQQHDLQGWTFTVHWVWRSPICRVYSPPSAMSVSLMASLYISPFWDTSNLDRENKRKKKIRIIKMMITLLIVRFSSEVKEEILLVFLWYLTDEPMQMPSALPTLAWRSWPGVIICLLKEQLFPLRSLGWLVTIKVTKKIYFLYDLYWCDFMHSTHLLL